MPGGRRGRACTRTLPQPLPSRLPHSTELPVPTVSSTAESFVCTVSRTAAPPSSYPSKDIGCPAYLCQEKNKCKTHGAGSSELGPLPSVNLKPQQRSFVTAAQQGGHASPHGIAGNEGASPGERSYPACLCSGLGPHCRRWLVPGSALRAWVERDRCSGDSNQAHLGSQQQCRAARAVGDSQRTPGLTDHHHLTGLGAHSTLLGHHSPRASGISVRLGARR
ncbi:uncharacterized protein LOC112581457 [Bubalus bubalis]|uniref:uncharacterized protein LOC112581457 n=1 Tax=Bubalus bubalis TaxID=89462 RepID=UPI001E1B627F|nr:uncharacterized protein LOC112581457 [Bubalus bubalis]